MAAQDRCPTHPGHPADDCGPCEAAIARAEDRRHDVDPDGWRPMQDAYERWLDEIGGSR